MPTYERNELKKLNKNTHTAALTRKHMQSVAIIKVNARRHAKLVVKMGK